MRHVSVLPTEVLTALAVAPNRNYVDCTVGDAGHAQQILEAATPNGRLLGIDADPEAILRSKKFLERFGERVIYARDSFRHVADVVAREKLAPVHGVLFDLGWSTPQFEERGRGFSFQKDEPLDMRYAAGAGDMHALTAADLLATKTVAELTIMFSRYGGEKYARPIARAIVQERYKKPITHTGQLVALIESVIHTRKEKIHPATRVFQALRIAVNDEFGALQEGLIGAAQVLAPGGRLVVISFHSGEDRIVKRFLRVHPELREIVKKPLIAQESEVTENPRARSAKLRVAEKIAT